MKIKIVVEGGVVQSVFSDKPCEVEVLDFDNMEADGLSNVEAELLVTTRTYQLSEVF